MVLDIILQVFGLLAIIIGGAFVVVIVTELILLLLDSDKPKKEKEVNNNSGATGVINDDDIIVYKNKNNPNDAVGYALVDEVKEEPITEETVKVIGDDKIQKIDFDKAIEEQMAINNKISTSKEDDVSVIESDETTNEDDIDEFKNILDDVAIEAMAEYKNNKKQQQLEKEKEEKQKLLDEKAEEEKLDILEQQEKQKVAEELEIQKKSQEEQEAYAKLQQEKEELAKLEQENLEKAKLEQEEIAKANAEKEKEVEELRKQQNEYLEKKQAELDNLKLERESSILEVKKLQDEILAEKQEVEKLREELGLKQSKLEEDEEKRKKEEQERIEELNRLQKEANDKINQEPIKEITIETVIDETEVNRLKQMNLKRMDARLDRLLKETNKIEDENERKRVEALNKLNNNNHKSKYSLNNDKKAVALSNSDNVENYNKVQEVYVTDYVPADIITNTTSTTSTEEHYVEQIISEGVVKNNEVIRNLEYSDDDNSGLATKESKTIVKIAIEEPANEKSFYENNLEVLQSELKDAEKDLKVNRSEYIPLSRINKAYERDTDKLRRKEMLVAKQKIALYGINSSKIDPVKKQKLEDNIKDLAELRDSVDHCKMVIDKNKDRYPILQKNNEIIVKQIKRLNEDIEECIRALKWFSLNKKKN